jgi:hypothetical protein
MLTLEQAQNLAAWVCTHDDGTPQPRAEVFALNTPGGYGVRIYSQDNHPDGSMTEVELAYTVAGARSILGY